MKTARCPTSECGRVGQAAEEEAVPRPPKAPSAAAAKAARTVRALLASAPDLSFMLSPTLHPPRPRKR